MESQLHCVCGGVGYPLIVLGSWADGKSARAKHRSKGTLELSSVHRDPGEIAMQNADGRWDKEGLEAICEER
jgi:hypothetical protein